MKTFRASSGPFDQQLHFTTEEIDRMCRDALVQEKLLPTQPEAIRIDRFIDKHFGCPISYEDFGPGILGCTLFNPNGSVKLISISKQLDDGTEVGERRVRSTLAHEAGHGSFHASLFLPALSQGRMNLGEPSRENLDFQQRRILCRDTDVREGVGGKRPYDGRWWEWQANRAIGGLLLPSELVRLAVKDYLDGSAVTGLQALVELKRAAAVAHVASIFEVNPAVARIRLEEIYPAAAGQMRF
jgi:hypothetical protein